MYSTIRKVSTKKILEKHLKYLSPVTVRHNSHLIKSSIPDVNIPNVTIPEFIFKDFLKYPHKIAVECNVTGKKFTFEEILVKSRNLNSALRKKLKLTPGDIVAILLPNIPEYAICVLGSLLANLTVTTINPIYTPDEISRQLKDTEAKAIFTLTALAPLASASTKLANQSVPIITIKMQNTDSIPEGTHDLFQLVNTKLDIEDLPPCDTNDVAMLPYSSGTTGLPKGVQLTHRNIIANICQTNTSQLRLSSETSDQNQDVIPAILPFFHIFGMTGILFVHLHNLCKLVTLPKFSPEQFLHLFINHKPQVLIVVPSIVSLMANQPMVKKEYLQQIRVVFSGSAPLGIQDEEKLKSKVGNKTQIKQGYGLTETSPAVFMSSNRSINLGIRGTVGEIVPNTDIKLIKIDGSQQEINSPRELGEIFVKGPQVMKGYYKREEATKEVFDDGFFKTGDVAYYDENGMFFISERIKELIKVKGFQVAPAELEEILRNHPDLLEAGVIGVPHKQYGEVPRAYVVPKPNHKVDTDGVQRYVAEKVAKYKQLKGGIEIVDSIPKNTSGKILRNQLKKEYQKATK
ncbi:hypothetical protein RI129_007575 [Pyrocoelia pectoralis]|uniref:4-coumarate--CoA ligase n=1 Tax=Pyrocoelia pectoralis TaxID=417401 RepID=A0AAN7ZF07_9COLE